MLFSTNMEENSFHLKREEIYLSCYLYKLFEIWETGRFSFACSTWSWYLRKDHWWNLFWINFLCLGPKRSKVFLVRSLVTYYKDKIRNENKLQPSEHDKEDSRGLSVGLVINSELITTNEASLVEKYLMLYCSIKFKTECYALTEEKNNFNKHTNIFMRF